MKSRWLFSAAQVALIAAVVGGCGGKGGGSQKKSVRIDGSSTVYPISEAVAEEFMNANESIRVTAGYSGTGGGFKKFQNGEIDICDASREVKDAEKEACEKAGVEFIKLEVAFDGLAVVVNPKNDWCDSLTVDQLKELWKPGSKIKQWADLDPSWPKEDIKLFGPGTDSGTFDYFTKAIVGKEKASRDDYTPSEDDNMLVKGVSEEPNGLGYFGFAYYAENQKKLKLLGVDNNSGKPVKPSATTVRDKTYEPLSRPLFIYVSKPAMKRPEVVEFVQFYLDNAAKLATEVGYVPVSDEVAKTNSATFKAATTGGEKK